MADDANPHDPSDDDDEDPGSAEATPRTRLAALMLRREKLTAGEAALLDAEFSRMLSVHHGALWDRFRRRGLMPDEVEDLVQDTFEAFYKNLVAEGLAGSMTGRLFGIAHGKLLNHLRDEKRARVSIGLPSSGSEKPLSGPDLERMLDLWNTSQELLAHLTQDQLCAVEKVILNGLTHEEAAVTLDIPEGTLKSRLLAAKEVLVAEAKRLLPPSQRGTR